MIGMYELNARYDARKSFYGKAKVVETQDSKELYSYDTLVAKVTTKNHGYIIPAYAEVYGIYSDTTLRHIKEFLKQEGFKAESKSQIERDYIN